MQDTVLKVSIGHKTTPKDVQRVIKGVIYCEFGEDQIKTPPVGLIFQNILDGGDSLCILVTTTVLLTTIFVNTL